MMKTLLLLSIALSFASAAFAEATVNIRNCTDTKKLVFIYNGDEQLFTAPAKSFALKPDGASVTRDCKGKGKNRCKVHVCPNDPVACQASAIAQKNIYIVKNNEWLTMQSKNPGESNFFSFYVDVGNSVACKRWWE